MSNELITLDGINPLELFSNENGLDPIIEEIRKKVKSEIYDISTDDGRKRIGSIARQIGSSKTKLKEMSTKLTADWQQKTKAVTKEATRMEKVLDALRDEIKKPLDEYNEKIKLRKEERETRIDAMERTSDFTAFTPPDSAELKDAIKTLELLYAIDFDDSPYQWDEFADRAKIAYEQRLEILNKMLSERVKYEAEQAELAELRKKDEERCQKERDDKLKAEAAEAATKQAEENARIKAEEVDNKAKAEIDKIATEKAASEKARIDAEARTKEAKQKAERDAETAKIAQAEAVKREGERIEAEKQAEIDAATKREDNKKHKAKIHNEALSAIESIVLNGDGEVKEIIIAIAKGEIPHVAITY